VILKIILILRNISDRSREYIRYLTRKELRDYETFPVNISSPFFNSSVNSPKWIQSEFDDPETERWRGFINEKVTL